MDSVMESFYGPFMGQKGDSRQGKRNNNESDNRQTMLERMYFRILAEYAMNRFKWEGLPESSPVRYVEQSLFYYALAVAFEDKRSGKLFIIRGAPSGTKNVVDDPLRFTLTGSNFQGITLSSRNCVPVWANYMRMPDLDIVTTYAFKLAQADRTIEINMNSARRTKVIVTGENQRLSSANINRAIERGDASISVNFQLGDVITALDLGVDPKSIETLSIVRGRLWSECMGLLGINNANQDKKERLVASEVDANNDQVEASRAVALNERQVAAKKITAKYAHLLDGKEVTVDYNTSLQAVDPMIGGVRNGIVHDGV